MNSKFANLIESLHPSFERLMAMESLTNSTLPMGMPRSGIYLFSEADDHLYVGRSKRMRDRLKRHSANYAGHNVASFAFRMAREKSGQTRAAYTSEGSRAALQEDPHFAQLFDDAKARIREMDVRYVEEIDQLRQALLEMYVHVVLDTPYNDFDTH